MFLKQSSDRFKQIELYRIQHNKIFFLFTFSWSKNMAMSKYLFFHTIIFKDTERDPRLQEIFVPGLTIVYLTYNFSIEEF